MKRSETKTVSRRRASARLDIALLGRWEKALAGLTDLRQQAMRQSLHSQREALAKKAWRLAGPLYDVLDAAKDEDADRLSAGLDRALMGVIDDPAIGRPIADEAPGEERRPMRRAPLPCCMTRIRLRNLLAVPARVRASGALGTTTTHIFSPNERRSLRRKAEEQTNDDDDGQGGGITIPGGLGQCVTITVEIQNALGEWVEILSREVCCHTHQRGDLLRSTPAPPPPGATTRPREVPVLEIVALDAERPCPEGDAQLAPGGGHGHEYRKSPGMDLPGKGHFIGAHIFLLFIPPPACRQFCFIQAVRRTVTLNGRKIAASSDWHLDLLPEQDKRPGCYAYQRDRPEGGRVLNDSPGLVNPWGAFQLEDGSRLTPRPGDRLVVHWEFRTWAVCLQAPALLGQFTWSLKVEVLIPNGPPPKGGQLPGTKIDLREPVFSPPAQISADDLKLYQRLTN
ncbi:hypothetical protein [Arenimonas sp.]|uniref:hypothetical protein n=1 Tax=Arenimonas sp. TaxID=1872635 RepID=UPI0039E4C5C7